MDLNVPAFYNFKCTSVSDGFHRAFDEHFWLHAITFNQGNDRNVTRASVEGRLRYLRSKLLRKIFGNHWRGNGYIHFLVFKHGSEKSFNAHYHALMGITGDHHWSDFHVQQAAYGIDATRPDKNRNEKPLHIDCDWEKGNRMHSYVSRDVQNGSDDYFFV